MTWRCSAGHCSVVTVIGSNLLMESNSMTNRVFYMNNRISFSSAQPHSTVLITLLQPTGDQVSPLSVNEVGVELMQWGCMVNVPDCHN